MNVLTIYVKNYCISCDFLIITRLYSFVLVIFIIYKTKRIYQYQLQRRLLITFIKCKNVKC